MLKDETPTTNSASASGDGNVTTAAEGDGTEVEDERPTEKTTGNKDSHVFESGETTLRPMNGDDKAVRVPTTDVDESRTLEKIDERPTAATAESKVDEKVESPQVEESNQVAEQEKSSVATTAKSESTGEKDVEPSPATENDGTSVGNERPDSKADGIADVQVEKGSEVETGESESDEKVQRSLETKDEKSEESLVEGEHKQIDEKDDQPSNANVNANVNEALEETTSADEREKVSVKLEENNALVDPKRDPSTAMEKGKESGEESEEPSVIAENEDTVEDDSREISRAAEEGGKVSKKRSRPTGNEEVSGSATKSEHIEKNPEKMVAAAEHVEIPVAQEAKEANDDADAKPSERDKLTVVKDEDGDIEMCEAVKSENGKEDDDTSANENPSEPAKSDEVESSVAAKDDELDCANVKPSQSLNSDDEVKNEDEDVEMSELAETDDGENKADVNAKPNVSAESDAQNVKPSEEESAPVYYVEETAWRMHNPDVSHCDRPMTNKDMADNHNVSKHLARKRKKNAIKGGRFVKAATVPAAPLVSPVNDPLSVEVTVPPLPPALDVPSCPNTGRCVWSFDENTRVMYANFVRDGIPIHGEDRRFLLRMMERDDMTVVSDGLVDGLDSALWDTNYVSNCVGNEVHHRVRSFMRDRDPETGVVSLTEADGWVSIQIKDYVRYLRQRRRCFRAMNKSMQSSSNEDDGVQDETAHRDEDAETFTYEDHSGGPSTSAKDVQPRTTSLNCIDECLYLIDYDIGKLLPSLKEDFCRHFRLPSILPGGDHCTLHAVNQSGRPFMGPNLYVTPPASFTHFHQDGHGTVDSGHVCLQGYNEVVILRRLTENHKRHALYLLNGNAVAGRNLESDAYGVNEYDALYGRPHDDGYSAKPMWPTKSAIEKCREMNYYPSVFILKPGQHVHINKGRLHAFRKMGPTDLPVDDCHCDLRKEINSTLNTKGEETLCMSVAWDWMYLGATTRGINREIASVLECSRLNRTQLRQSLAIPETCVLQMARFHSGFSRPSRSLTAAVNDDDNDDSNLFTLPHKSPKEAEENSKETKKEEDETPQHAKILKGILPSLEHIILNHAATAKTTRSFTGSRLQRVCVAARPNTWENPDTSPLDPYGSGDFFCKLCSVELSNVYMHCNGCEDILKKDFNICTRCHQEERYKIFYQMHPLNNKRHCTINHTGNFERLNQKRCPCKNGPACNTCGYCSGCSCKCHRSFTLQYRFMSIDEEMELLDKVKECATSGVVGTKDDDEDSLGEYAEETRRRLASGEKKPAGEDTGVENEVVADEETQTQAQAQAQVETETETDTSSIKKKRKIHKKMRNRNRVKEEEAEDNIDMEDSMEESTPRRQSKRQKFTLSTFSDSNYRKESSERRERYSAYRDFSGFSDQFPDESPSSVGSTGYVPRSRSIFSNFEKKVDRDQDSANPRNFNWKIDVKVLEMTKPKGDDIFIKKASKITNLPLEDIRVVFSKAKDMKCPTIKSIWELLDRSFDKSHVWHLYRNFHDREPIDGDPHNKGTVYYTRREIDILAYCLHRVHGGKNVLSKYHYLIPYRKRSALGTMLDKLRKMRVHENEEYMDNVFRTIQATIMWENVQNLPQSAPSAEPDESEDPSSEMDDSS